MTLSAALLGCGTRTSFIDGPNVSFPARENAITAGDRILDAPPRHTSDPRSAHRGAGLETGADDFIGKPIDPSELSARCRSLIRIGRAIREQGRAIKERAANIAGQQE